MAKPRIFLSSTYYDLKHIRKSIETFISDMGYESVLFESGDIPFDHKEPLDESCYKELDSCHILVLIIGGRYGSNSSDKEIEISEDDLEGHYQHFNSITKKEYEAAKSRDMPIYIFVEKGVSAEYQTYKENRVNDSIKYAHVDNVNIFKLLDSIHSQKINNLVRDFENVEDITQWLKDQWAGLFTQHLLKKSSDAPIASLEKQLANLGVVTETLKDYSQNILEGLSPDKFEQIISSIGAKEKHRSELSGFMRNNLIEHISRMCDIDIDNLYDVFVDSKNAKEFIDIGFKSVVDEETFEMDIFSHPGLFESELNGLRNKLELPEWPRITSKSSRRKKTRG